MSSPSKAQVAPNPEASPFIAKFGPFQFNSETFELRKHDTPLRLQSKPAAFLKTLLECPGEIVGRAEVQNRLWANEAYGDFDAGLNTALRRLRVALGDSAEHSLYIETVARTGYRFIAPVELTSLRTAAPATPDPPVIAPATVQNSKSPFSPWGWLWLATTVALLAVIAVWLLRRPIESRFQQITFRRGHVTGAFFAPDGQSIVYSARWGLEPKRMFVTNGVSPESRDLGWNDFNLIGVSSKGELLMSWAGGTMPIGGSDLYRVPMNGGQPQPVSKNAMSAAWARGGSDMLIVRSIEGANILEFPVGTPRHRTTGWISDPHVSPDGSRIAFIEHPFRHDDRGTVTLLKLSDQSVRKLGPEWVNAGGLAWNPNGRDVWFSATSGNSPKALWSVSEGREPRLLAASAGALTIEDAGPNGQALVTRDTRRLEMGGRLSGMSRDEEFSWMDWSRAVEVSTDNKLLLFDESGEAAGHENVTYLRDLASGGVTRIADARAMSLSPDSRSILLLPRERSNRFRIRPLDSSAEREIPSPNLSYQWGRYFPDGQSLLVSASEPGGGLKLYRQWLATPDRKIAISHLSAVRNAAISANGTEVAYLDSKGQFFVTSALEANKERLIPTEEPLAPLLWSQDGKTVYVHHARNYTEVPARVSKLELATGKVTPWKTIGPADPLGVNLITRILLLDETGERYIYSFRRVLSELFLVSGLN